MKKVTLICDNCGKEDAIAIRVANGQVVDNEISGVLMDLCPKCVSIFIDDATQKIGMVGACELVRRYSKFARENN